MTDHQETTAEEIANSITHAIGVILSIVALVVLVVLSARQGDVWKIISFSIYGTSLILLYSASAFYHGFRSEKLKHFFHVLDHSFIYLLIAGTYTPFTLVSLRGPWGWSLFGVIWGLTIAGTLFKTAFTGRYNTLSVIVYVLMGWVVVVAIKPMLVNVSATGLILLLSGGLLYTLGILFYRWKSLPFSHAVWHLFVLGGSICHFWAIYFSVLPAE
ncbi:MAG: hemolysin III family protein [FCB group bacterium]|nr:hemolysin III family protein [FCB group bacterium]